MQNSKGAIKMRITEIKVFDAGIDKYSVLYYLDGDDYSKAVFNISFQEACVIISTLSMENRINHYQPPTVKFFCIKVGA